MSVTETLANPLEIDHKAVSNAIPALDIQNISFRYKNKQALDRVSVTLSAGENVILLGPNGAGKTTLFSLICGLFAADSGSILINGRSLLKQSDALAPLGIVFQSQTLDLDLSVQQNLRYFCALHGIERKSAINRIEIALKRLGLYDRKNEKVRTLNGGHRRRVEIARATLHHPSVLLLDEPTVGLDIPTRMELLDYLRELPKLYDCAVLWATHLTDEIQTEDRILMLHQGRVHLDGSCSELLRTQAAPDLSALMHKVMNT